MDEPTQEEAALFASLPEGPAVLKYWRHYRQEADVHPDAMSAIRSGAYMSEWGECGSWQVYAGGDEVDVEPIRTALQDIDDRIQEGYDHARASLPPVPTFQVTLQPTKRLDGPIHLTHTTDRAEAERVASDARLALGPDVVVTITERMDR